MTSNNDKASQAFEDWLNRQYSKSQRDKFDLDDYRRLKDSFLAGVASVAQDRDGVLDEVVTAIEEIMNDYRGPIDIFYGKYQTTNSGEAILKVVLALKRQPKE
jgi:hypothetical protein